MFYERYVDLCSKRNVSPSRVAVECGFNKGSVSVWKKKYEAGEDVAPSSEILRKLADYFCVSVDFLLSGGDDSRVMSEKDTLKIALWRGDSDIVDDEMIEDVIDFAQRLAAIKKRKMEQSE